MRLLILAVYVISSAAAREPLQVRIRHTDRSKFTMERAVHGDRKSTRLNSSHSQISYAVFCLTKKNTYTDRSSMTSISTALDQRTLAIWAFDCAEPPLDVLSSSTVMS